ncbi:D-glycerate dehydrogenase [Candidatus Bathyarchaeota archaeon]|nr:D-glycerate dehydrogenase [Candidatus Bathyarchaeota archaeon]
MVRPRVIIWKQMFDQYEKVRKMLEPVADVEFSDMGSTADDMAKYKEQLATAEGLFKAPRDRINEEILQCAPKLKIVANYGVGYDGNDIEAMTRHKVYLTNTPGVLSDAVADLTLAFMLTLNRKILQCDKYVREGSWAKNAPGNPSYTESHDMKGKTVGIIGLGRIGFETARRCMKGFDMNIIYYDIFQNKKAEVELGAKQKTLDEVMKESDYIVIHTELTSQTRKIIDEKHLRMMKKTAYIINTARGQIIDQVALAKVLSEGIIAGAGLDVFEVEPCPSDDPILRSSRTVLTPHKGSGTAECREAMAICNAENVVAVLRGEIPPPNVVPEQKGMIFKK